ncbi:hypothetical protein D0817_23715 [Flavobacterium cupreum]|uniref:Uncharacterized protein n=1 Tax=Flavobacterium cupreum TaxID=2133766 RepID=A0A434A0P3_9FLAO|nr:primase-helicase family protein [Flavobacterium cupreum]RUT67944.1 hypothetical protein D0817_23715 [Flavobacterium cupreum]
MANYKFNVETLYEKTDNGLDIIKKYLDNCDGFSKALENDKNAFRYRDTDKSASCYLVKNDKGLKGSIGVNYWRVKDFGGDFFTPIGIAMEQSGLDFYPCLKMLYEWFNLDGNNTFFTATVEITTLDDKDKRPLDWFNVVTKEHTQLDIIGTYVTAELAKEYDFFSVEYYEKIFINKKTNQKNHIKVSATESFPIFCYMPEKTWCKTYAPFSKDKSFKHGYLGKKPVRHVYGLQRIIKKYDDKIDDFNRQIKKTKGDKTTEIRLIEERDAYKIPNCIVASGGSDGLNVASLGYDLIWYNSESEQINYTEYNQLKEICKNIYNLPDLDESGVKYGYEVAEKFWNMKSIWLPKEKLGTNGKDFRDWMKFYKKADLGAVKFQFGNLLTGALKMKFFEKNEKSKRWSVKTSYLHYFLKIKGFHLYYPEKKYTEKTGVQEFIFIRINEHIVEQFFPNDIRKFTEMYLIEKGQPIEVIDLIKNTEQFNEPKLLSMDKIVLDFKNFTEETQTFFYKNQFATISKDGIELKPYKDLKNYVWDYRIVNKTIFAEKQSFRHYKDDNCNDRVEILQKDCDFMNYLINGSRMSWRKELEEPFGDFSNNKELKEAKQKYHDENRFNLSAECLTESERLIQEKHFLNKCFGIGYLLHRYKIESFAKFIYIMDDAPKESEEDSNGRSGKSVLLNGIDKLLNNHYYINGKSKNITTNSHLLDGFTKENDYLRIEDIDQYLGVEFFYNWVTGPISVNPKTKKPYNVEFHDAGKMAATSNFGIGKINQSTLGRLFFISFSDYYHVKTDKYNEERKISHDFNNKDLFSSYWDEKQWNKFYYFLMECCQLYLSNRDNELQAPQTNIHLTNIQASMGENFMNWCDSYFTLSMIDEDSATKEIVHGTLNRFLLRDEVQKAYTSHAGEKYKKTATNFKKSLGEYCKMKGWTFNPVEYLSADKKTIKKPHTNEKGNRNILEFFYVRTNDIEVSIPEQKELNLGDRPDDLPF